MRFIVSIAITVILAFIGGLWLPWWSIAIAAFITAALVHQSPIQSFLSGFLALFILWGGLAWRIDMQNQGILSKKIALILPLSGNSFLLIFVTAFVGAIIAGMAAISASFLRYAR
ncbi:MAG: hypothetical protein WDO19_00420 [Bacteroidota bacterium]